MKELIESMKFTKKSIFPVLLIISGLILVVYTKIGFKDKISTITTIIALSFLLILFFGYTIYVHCLYHKLPKNKTTDTGVLFYINTHNNTNDYKAITEKFCERFEELSESIEKNKLVAIILTEKQVSTIKNIANREVQHNLLKRTNCSFGVFMKSTDLGQESDEYELHMDAMISHPLLNEVLEKTLANNFSCVFKGLHSRTLNKKEDLKNLQNMSTQLYFVCQLIFAVTNIYCGFISGALHLLKEIDNKIKNETSIFYKQLRVIVNNELCASAIYITTTEYINFIYKGQYGKEKVKDALNIMQQSISIIQNDNYNIDYHLSKAVYNLLCGNIIESKGEISLLEKNYKHIKPNQRTWAYSNAFLIAYENKPNKYKTINEKYKLLKNNKTQDPLMIYHFIGACLDKHPNNLGLKIALFLLTFYKQDELNCNILPSNLQHDIVEQLNILGQVNYAKFINDLEFKK